MRSGLLCTLLVLLGCQRPAEHPEAHPTEVQIPESDASESASRDLEDASAEVLPSARATAIGDWGVSIEVPPSATVEHQAEARRHAITLSEIVSVSLYKIDKPAPPTLAEAERAWAQPNSTALGQGETDNGILYALRGLTVRVGFPGLPGQTVHRLKRVFRVYAVMPLDAQSHVTCTGYVERELSTAEDPDLMAVKKICLSMRKR